MSATLNARDMAIDFDGWVQKLPEQQRAGIMDHLSGLQDAAAEKRKLANIFWIAERQRLPLRTVSDNYNALLAAHATREGWGDAFAKDEAFHARVVSEAATELNEEVMIYGDRSKGETEQNRESIRKSLMWKAYEAGQNPKGSRFQAMADSFARWNTAASKSPSYRPQNAGKYWNQWVQQFERGYQVFEPARQAADRVFPRLRFGDDYNPTDAEPFIADLTDDQFSVMLREMRIKADKKGGQGEQPMDMIEGIGQSAGRAVARNVAGAADFLGKRALDYKFREGEQVRADWLAKGVPFMAETVAATAGTEGLTEGYSPPDDAPRVALTAEQAKEANAFLERKQRVIRRLSTLRDFREGTINPIGDDDSITDAAVYGAAQSLGQMATVAVPYLGTATAWASYANDAENRYIANGFTPEDARKLAPWTGALQAAADRMQLGLFKKIPALDQVFVRFGARIPNAFVARASTIWAGETLIELGQDEIAPELIADIGKAVGATMKGGDWEDMAERLKKSGVDMFPSMLLLGLVGGGAASWRDVQNFKALTSDPELLKAYGFTAEHAAAIALAADSREAATLVRQFWGERKKTSSKKSNEQGLPPLQPTQTVGLESSDMEGRPGIPGMSSQRGMQLLPEQQNAQEQEAGTKDRRDGLREGWTFTDFAEYDRQQNIEAGIVALRRDDDGWRVVLEDGGSVQVGTVEAAMHLRDTLKRAKTEREAAALVAIADEIAAGFAKEGRKSEQIFTGDLYQVVDGNVSKTDRSGKTSDIKFFGNTAAELNREAEMVGGTRQFIQGANWIAEDGTRMMQTNLSGDRVFTMIHEMAETRLRAIMREDAGASAVAAARVLAKTSLFDPARQRSKEDKELAQRVQNIAAGKTNETEARETIVELVVANWLSRRKDGSNFAAGSVSAAIDEAARSLASAADVKALNWFRSMLRVVKAYLRGIFGMAAKLAKARRDGTLKDGDDFSTLADKLMGLDPQRKHNEEVVKEVAKDESFSIRAFHGTPHTVDKFRLDKIGTGEGAQVYGWGLYFAENILVGKEYAKLSDSIDIANAPEGLREILQDVFRGANPQEAKEKWLKAYKADADLNQGAFSKNARKVYKYIQTLTDEDIRLGKGNIYTVDLDVEPDDLLDWDKPLSEQSEKIKAAIQSQAKDAWNAIRSWSGNDYYRRYWNAGFDQDSSSAARLASKSLAALGIKGIRFLDGNSRAAGEGSYNYVIFDENVIKIKEANGQPVTLQEASGLTEPADGAGSFSLGRITPAQDAAYMAAVEKGDMETAQRMVDAAAKAAGYRFEAWHNSENKFDVFDIGYARTSSDIQAFFFKDQKDPFKEYGRNEYHVYLKIDNPANYRQAVDGFDPASTDDAGILQRKKLQAMGYDGFIVSREDGGMDYAEIGAFRPSQIKSADPVTYDADGNVIPLSQRFNSARDEITYSLASGGYLEALATQIENTALPPRKRLRMYQEQADTLRGMARAMMANDADSGATSMVAIDRQRAAMREAREAELLEEVERDFGDLEGVEFLSRAMNQPVIDAIMRQKPGDQFPRSRIRSLSKAKAAGRDVGGSYDGSQELPRWIFGGTESPDNIAQELYNEGLIREPSTDALWREIEKALKSTGAAKERLSDYAQRRAAARQQARDEANAWADEQIEKLPAKQRESERNELRRSLIVLDALLMRMPSEVRGKVGGFVQLSQLTTDKARAKFLSKRIEKMGRVFEEFLRKEYSEKMTALVDRAERAANDAGKKPSSVIGADAHALIRAMGQAMKMNGEETDAEVARLSMLIDGGTLTPEQEALAMRQKELVGLAGDWRNLAAADMAAAYEAAEVTYDEGWMAWSKTILERRERREAARKALKSDTGKTGDDTEKQARAEKDMGWTGQMKKIALSLSSFQEAMRYVFGKDSTQAKEFVDWEREASNAKEDAIQEIGDRVSDWFTERAGSVYAGTKLQWSLSQKSIDAGKAGKLSEMEAIQGLFMWNQEDGRRHLEAFGYDEEWAGKLRAGLSADGRAFMQFLRAEYDAQYAPLNALYRKRHGVNLPQHDNYAPITVEPIQPKQGEVVDPVTGTASHGSLLTPGSLRSRSRTATAQPRFQDALATYLAQTRQLEHWKAYYELAVEMQQVITNREVGNSVEAAGGEQAKKVLNGWANYFAQGGNRDAGAFLALNQGISNAASRAAEMILFGRVGTLVIQATQLGAALAEMPTGAYVKRLGMLLAGRLQWKDAIKSDYIQRRFKQAPPIVRQALNALAATEPNKIKHAARELGRLIAGADALFTGGTYAILLDYHRTLGRNAGLSGAALDAYAHREAEAGTDRVAQPTRAGARSLFENTTTSALGRVGWAFASEARQKIALAAWAARTLKSDPARFARIMGVVWGAGGLGAAMIRAAWRDMKDEEDDEVFDGRNWNIARLAAGTIAGPFQGVPVIGDLMESAVNRGFGIYSPEGDILSQASQGASAAGKIVTGKTLASKEPIEDTMKAVKSIMFTLGIANDTMAGATSLANIIEDAAKVVDALEGPDKPGAKR